MTRSRLSWSDLASAYRDGAYRGETRLGSEYRSRVSPGGVYRAGAPVGLWGLGREGHASLRKLRAMGVEPVLVDDNPGEEGVLKTADGGLAALKRCEVV